MTLEEWLAASQAKTHKTGRNEIASLLKAADRDLADSQLVGLSLDRKFTTAYGAALLAATAALAAAGYRAPGEGHHYWTIQSLAFTIGTAAATVNRFDAFRRKRNIADYETVGLISETEVKSMLALARSLRNEVAAWLKKNPRRTRWRIKRNRRVKSLSYLLFLRGEVPPRMLPFDYSQDKRPAILGFQHRL